MRARKIEFFFPFYYYSPLDEVRIGCNWGFGFKWFSHHVTLLYSSFDSEFFTGSSPPVNVDLLSRTT